MTELKILQTPKLTAHEQTIQALEEMLEEARAGRVHAVAIAATGPEGNVHTNFTGSPQNIFELLGAIDYLHIRVSERIQRP